MKESGRKSIKICIALVAIAVLITAGSAQAGWFDRDTKPELNREIITSGTGKIVAQPDEATLVAGATTQAATASEAQNHVSAIMQKVIPGIRNMGIADKDIKTIEINVYPVYSYENKTPQITGYSATNRIEVTIRDISKTGAVIDTAIKGGANQIQGVTFTLSDSAAMDLREKALTQAVENSQKDANALANASGVKLTGPIKISTGGPEIVPFFATPGLSKAEAPTPVQPGEVTVSATVQITYGFRQ